MTSTSHCESSRTRLVVLPRSASSTFDLLRLLITIRSARKRVFASEGQSHRVVTPEVGKEPWRALLDACESGEQARLGLDFRIAPRSSAASLCRHRPCATCLHARPGRRAAHAVVQRGPSASCGLQRLGCVVLQVNGDKDLAVGIGLVLLDHKHRSLAPGQEAGRCAAQEHAFHRARAPRTQYQKARLVGDTEDLLDHDADEHLRADPAIVSVQRSGVLGQVGLGRRYPAPAFGGIGPVVPRRQQRRLDDMHDTQQGAVLIGQLRSTPNRGSGVGRRNR